MKLSNFKGKIHDFQGLPSLVPSLEVIEEVEQGPIALYPLRLPGKQVRSCEHFTFSRNRESWKSNSKKKNTLPCDAAFPRRKNTQKKKKNEKKNEDKKRANNIKERGGRRNPAMLIDWLKQFNRCSLSVC